MSTSSGIATAVHPEKNSWGGRYIVPRSRASSVLVLGTDGREIVCMGIYNIFLYIRKSQTRARRIASRNLLGFFPINYSTFHSLLLFRNS